RMHFYPYSDLHSDPTTPYVAGRDCVLSSGAAAYWRLGGAQGNSLRDEMGATWGNYANTTGFGYTGALPADPDTAVNFSGVDDYAVVADAGPAVHYGFRTLSAWNSGFGSERRSNPRCTSSTKPTATPSFTATCPTRSSSMLTPVRLPERARDPPALSP
ncbi:MAG: hypothetical protein ONB06_10175, partial [candidate division KSB1 bacterium]|nr:hypothetical protein [candidate division KSB1 bacterium]